MEKNETWNKEKYDIFINKLYEKADLGYVKFLSNLGINEEYIIGIRNPETKKITKEISQTDYISFINYNTHNTYEERMIHGLLLGYIKDDFSTIQKLLRDYIKHIDNWALCDSTVANLHIWKKNVDDGYSFVEECLNSENIWSQRVGFILLLDYYINDEYIDIILKWCNNFKTEDYYVQMAIAWLISTCYIKYPEKTDKFLENNKMSKWIQNKSIQKIRESNRVLKEDKDKLLKWKK
jgi:Predicted DNA alkylation repair enzyme